MTTQADPDYDELVDDSEEAVERSPLYGFGRIALPVVLGLSGAVVAATTSPLWTSPLGAIAGAAVGYLILVGIVALRARKLATTRFFVLWADRRGFLYDPSPPVYRDTALLRAGDEQFAGRSFAGALAGLEGSVYQHTKRVKRTSTDSRGHTTTTNDDTDYIVLRLGLTVPGFDRLQLHPRGFGSLRLFDGLESKLTSNRVVELESEELAKEYKLEVADGVDEVTLRRLFTPAAIAHILDAFPEGVGLELEGSTLVFFRQGSITPKKMEMVEQLVADVTPFTGWLRSA